MDLVLQLEEAVTHQTELCASKMHAVSTRGLRHKLGTSKTGASGSEQRRAYTVRAPDHLAPSEHPHHLRVLPATLHFYSEIDTDPPEFLERSPECLQV